MSIVGRVWPRHSGGGRPLNSVVRRHLETSGKNCVAAGILYGMLALFAGATIAMLWSLSPYDTARFFSETVAGNWPLFLGLFVLSAASIGLSVYLLVHRKCPANVLYAGAALALMSVGWNIIAMALWVLPALFLWRARVKQ